MDIIFIQHFPLDGAIGWREGGLKRLAVMVGHWRSAPEVIGAIHLVVPDSDFDFVRSRLGDVCVVLRASGSDSLPCQDDRLVVVEEPNFNVAVTHVRRLKQLSGHQMGRKVIRLESRSHNTVVGFRAAAFSRELTNFARERGFTAQAIAAVPWSRQEFVYEEVVPSVTEDERAAYGQKIAMTDFPSQLVIEPTSNCNLKCTMCPYHSEAYREPRVGPYIAKEEFRHIDTDLFRRLIDEAAAMNLKTFIPQSRGEPFLNPKLMEMLEYAISKGVDHISFPNNGTALNDDKIKRLVDMGLAQLQFSIDALSREAYMAIRIGSNFDKVQANLRKIVEYRNQKGLTKPHIGLTFVDQPSNAAEREEYVKHYMEIVDHVRTTVGVEYNQLHYTGLPRQYFDCSDEWRAPCRLIVDQMVIFNDGKSWLCHSDTAMSCEVGDVTRDSIKDVFNGSRLREIREAHLAGDYSALPVCSNCQLWKADISRELPSYDPENIAVSGGPMTIQYTRKRKQAPAPQQEAAQGLHRRGLRKLRSGLRRLLQR